MHFLYILYSKKLDRYYIGETSDVENRLEQHMTHYFPKSFTKSAEDWELMLKIGLETQEEAKYLERFIKRMKSRKFIEKILENPEIIEDILRNQK